MVLQELKKIWTPMRMALLILVSALMYASLLSPIIRRFDSGGGGFDAFQEKLRISKEWTKNYGDTIEPEEFSEIEKGFEEIIGQIGENMSQKEIFNECGVGSYEEFLVYETNAVNGKEGFDYEKYKEMRDQLFVNTSYNSVYLQEYQKMMVDYEKATVGNNAILPWEVSIYTTDFLMYLSLWCFITVLLISAPVMVNDVASNMKKEQYSSKVGRRIYKVQYWCTVFSVLVTEITVIAAGMAIWSTTDTFVFSGAGLNSFMSLIEPALDIRYADVFTLFIVIALLLGIGAGSITFCLSSRSSNVISMLMKVTPLAVVAGMYILGLGNAFYKNNVFYGLVHIPGIEVIVAGVIAVAGVVVNMVNYKNVKKSVCRKDHCI